MSVSSGKGGPPILTRLDSQNPATPTKRQIDERVDIGVATGGAVGVTLMACVLVYTTLVAVTPAGIFVGLGISLGILLACMVIGNVVARNLNAILGFFGRQPSAP
ncbi:MAG: hypothetical protein LBD72_03615 [Puniceicoccales bacterium]|nr:hypothetical protein [Puniceicoccales bacterium]